MGILEKISEIEKEIARTQKNKGKSEAFVGRINKAAHLVMFDVLNSFSNILYSD